MRKDIRTFLVLIIVGALTIPLAIGTHNDKATGGGWIDDLKKTFGFVATNNGGELQYDDHEAGINIHGIVDKNSITDSIAMCENSGTTTFTTAISNKASFTGVIKGTTDTFAVCVNDNGEPGTGKDTFSIVTSTGYKAGGILKGGNIQVGQ